MNGADEEPRCPECGEPIGMTATYCMHCSADLTDRRAAVGDAGLDDGPVDGGVADAGPGDDGDADVSAALGVSSPAEDGQVLDPDGLVDDALTVVVGILGGVVVGVFGTVVLGALTGSWWSLAFGVAAWLGATAYLVRRRTVQAAVSKAAYGVAVVLLLVPAVALSPFVDADGGAVARGSLFVVLLVFVAVPALFAAAVGWVAGRFIPDDADPTGR